MDGDYKTSKINGAMLKMIRLDKSQTVLNEISTNLLAYNSEYGVYNFELKFSLADNLYMECKSKMNEDEIGEMDGMRSAISYFMEHHPIIERSKNEVRKTQQHYRVNHRNFNTLKKALFDYEAKARFYIDKYGMDTMYEEHEDASEY